jgi:hypothetical protein
MRIVSIDSTKITVSISGDHLPYIFHWTASFINDKDIKIEYTSTPEVTGRMNERLSITFFDVESFKNIDGVPMESSTTVNIKIDPIEISPSLSSSIQAMGYFYLLNLLISVAANILIGGTMELMWSLANTLQILYFLGLLDLKFPYHTLALFKFMSYSNFDFPELNLVFEKTFSSNYHEEDEINEAFTEMGFESRNFVSNASDSILFVSLLILSAIAVVAVFL